MIREVSDYEQRNFNRELSKVKSSVERAFRILKGRWRCLLKKMENQTSNISKVIIACCILHNIRQFNGDDYEDLDLETIIEQERRLRAERNVGLQRPNQSAIRIRNAFMTDMNTRL